MLFNDLSIKIYNLNIIEYSGTTIILTISLINKKNSIRNIIVFFIFVLVIK